MPLSGPPQIFPPPPRPRAARHRTRIPVRLSAPARRERRHNVLPRKCVVQNPVSPLRRKRGRADTPIPSADACPPRRIPPRFPQTAAAPDRSCNPLRRAFGPFPPSLPKTGAEKNFPNGRTPPHGGYPGQNCPFRRAGPPLSAPRRECGWARAGYRAHRTGNRTGPSPPPLLWRGARIRDSRKTETKTSPTSADPTDRCARGRCGMPPFSPDQRAQQPAAERKALVPTGNFFIKSKFHGFLSMILPNELPLAAQAIKQR